LSYPADRQQDINSLTDDVTKCSTVPQITRHVLNNIIFTVFYKHLKNLHIRIS